MTVADVSSGYDFGPARRWCWFVLFGRYSILGLRGVGDPRHLRPIQTDLRSGQTRRCASQADEPHGGTDGKLEIGSKERACLHDPRDFERCSLSTAPPPQAAEGSLCHAPLRHPRSRQ